MRPVEGQWCSAGAGRKTNGATRAPSGEGEKRLAKTDDDVQSEAFQLDGTTVRPAECVELALAGQGHDDFWLPFLSTYRTMCLAPDPGFRRVLGEIQELRLAA